MARLARVVIPNIPYHITQRGNYKQVVFRSVNDRHEYLKWISFYSQKFEVEILSYCLMNNHVHFIAVPRKEESFAKLFNIAHMRYTQYYNAKIKNKGHLWHGRFFSCALDEIHLLNAIRYVEQNPVRAGMVKSVIDYQWSSARARIEQIDDLLVKRYPKIPNGDTWLSFLSEQENQEFIDKFQLHTRTGRPIGREDFTKKIEKLTGRILTKKPGGRPKGSRNKK
jgi:putative transposase